MERDRHRRPDQEEEPRFDADLLVRVFGMDTASRPFSQQAHARNISDHGAKLAGLERQVKPGDIIGVQHGNTRARCRVIWAWDVGKEEELEVGVKLEEGQPCPWQAERETQQASATLPISRTSPWSKERRRYSRHRIVFPIEIRDGQGAGRQIQMNTADIGGGGCYIETLLPLPVGRLVTVSFWLNSERVQTTAIVRTSDGGVGMGIEFTGLDDTARQQLQQQIDNLAAEAVPLTRSRGAF